MSVGPLRKPVGLSWTKKTYPQKGIGAALEWSGLETCLHSAGKRLNIYLYHYIILYPHPVPFITLYIFIISPCYPRYILIHLHYTPIQIPWKSHEPIHPPCPRALRATLRSLALFPTGADDWSSCDDQIYLSLPEGAPEGLLKAGRKQLVVPKINIL